MRPLKFVLALTFTALAGSRVIHAQTMAQPADVFEVVSIKLQDPAAGPGRAIPPGNAFGMGCDGGFPRVEHNRFTVTTTTYALLTWAYGFNKSGGCSFVSFGNFLTGGPDWIRNERFTIQAIMPEGSPDYTTSEFLNGKAPKLEAMIRNMLADQFKITLHREMKQGPVYELVVARGGPKLIPAKEDDKNSMVTARRTNTTTHEITSHVTARKTTMTYLALMLVLETRRPVIDKTGIAGEYNFDIDFAPTESSPDSTTAASIFTAIQEQLGLKLESARAPTEILVLDHAEKPPL